MKDGIAQVVGKQIAAVLIAENKRGPKNQVFLVFSDGTSFELHGENFNCCAGLDPAAGIAHSIASSGAKVVRMFGGAAEAPRAPLASSPTALTTGSTSAPYHVGADVNSLEEQLTRDLDAWRAAKAAIAKAKDG